jgi:hypothetical protein
MDQRNSQAVHKTSSIYAPNCEIGRQIGAPKKKSSSFIQPSLSPPFCNGKGEPKKKQTLRFLHPAKTKTSTALCAVTPPTSPAIRRSDTPKSPSKQLPLLTARLDRSTPFEARKLPADP